MTGTRQKLLAVAVCVCAATSVGVASEARGAATTHGCEDVVIRTPDGSVYTRTYELLAWRTGCEQARQVVRAYLHRSEGAVSRPRPFGFRCRTGRPGGRCRKGVAIVWWSWDLDIASCRYFDAPFPCPGERPCGRTPTISEGVSVQSSVFARGFSCERAKQIVGGGRIPPGWNGTGSGAGGIYHRGDSSLNATPAELLAKPHVRYSNIVFASRFAATALKRRVVLGSREFAPNGWGFGTAHPKRIFNGGVPSGLVHDIKWKRWGKKVAIGKGLGHQYKPEGGYYSKHVVVRMRARRLGRCPGAKVRAYRQLAVSFQNRPGGSFGRWFLWSGAGSICDSAY